MLVRPLLNQRPPKLQVTDQTAYAGVRFKYQVPEVTDPDGDDLTYDAVQGAAYNPLPDWLTFDSATRTFTGRQRTVHIDTYTIRVIVSDGQQTSWAEFTLSVVERPANLPPTAASLTDQTAAEDQAFSYVAPEFSDPDNNPLTYAAALDDGGTLPGWLSFNATNRTLSGTPLESDTPATHTIRITATDDATPPLSSSATFTLTVTEVNDAPLPGNDSASVAKGGSVEIAVTTLLANDTDPEGDSLSITAVSGAVNGSVALSEDENTVTYTHDGSETTSGSFTYTVSDGTATATGTVEVTVTQPNNAPAVAADTVTVAEGGEVNVSVATLLSNDTDSDGDTLSIMAVGGAVNGTVALSEDKSEVKYTHDGSETTSGSFTYTVSDGTATGTGTVSVTVTPVNDTPTGVTDTATVAEGGEVEIAVATLLANDTDSEGDSLSITGVGGAANGSVTVSEDKSEVTYTHDGSETSTDSFTYTVSDGTDTGTGTVSVTVAPVNDAPGALSLTDQTAIAGVSFSYQVPAVVDSDGDALTYTAFLGAGSNPLPDWLSFDGATRTFSGTPRRSHAGEYEIQVTVTDGEAAAKKAEFKLTVALPPNRPPDAPALAAQAATEDVAFSFVVPEFDDLDGDTVTYAAALDDGSALPGWLSFNASRRTFSGTPLEADTPASHTVKVTATDDGSPSKSSSATFTLTVTEVNDAPSPVDDTASVAEGGSVDVTATTLLADDTDPEGDTLSITAVGGAVNGSVALAEDKSKVTYTHDGSETTSGGFTYTVSDGTVTATGSVAVTVSPANDGPVVGGDTATVAEGSQVEILVATLLSNDSDPEGETLSVTVVGGAVNGAVTLSEDESKVTYTHDGSETTSGSFTYTVSDGTAAATGTVSVTVTPVNDAPAAVADTLTVAEGGEVEVAVTTLLANDTDAEGESLSFTAVGGAVNGSVALSEDKSKVTYTHDGSETTSGSFTYTVSDGTAKGSGTVSVTVTPVNDPPGELTLTDQTATAGVAFSYQVPAVVDPEGDGLTYQAILGPGTNTLPDWLGFAASTRIFSGTPRKAHVGEYEIKVEVSDGAVARTGAFKLTVALPPNRPPGAPALTSQTATEDVAFSYAVPEFEDPDENAVTYAATLDDGGALPGWLSFNAASRTLSGTPLETDTPATHSIRMTATDDGSPSKSSSATFTLTVAEVNDAPTAFSLADQAAIVARPFSYTFAAVTDPEGGNIAYAATVGEKGVLPSWLSFDASALTLSGTPGEGDAPAELTIRITATDGGEPPLASSAEFKLTVSAANGAPHAVDDEATVAEGHTLTIPSSVFLTNDSDPDGQTLVISSVGDAVNGTVALSGDGTTVTYRHSGIESTSGSFTYTVSDGTATDTATVALTVTPVNDPPAAPSVAARTAVEDEPFSYRFAAVTDAEGDGATYTSTLAGGGALPPWLSFNAGTRTFSGTPREDDTPATLVIVVTASDDGEPAESATSTFTLTVVAVNDPPNAPSVADRTAFVGVPFIYAVPAAYDSDSRTLVYFAAQGQGLNPLPRWLAFDEDARTFSGTPLKADLAEHEIVVSVSDDLHTSWAAFTLSVAVAPNRPPIPPDIPSQEATEDLPFTFVVPPFADPDEDSLEYSAGVAAPDGTVVGLPQWLAFEPTTLVLSGTPREDDTPSELTIVVTAIDDGEPPASAEATFTLDVAEINDAPTARAGADQTVAGGSVVTLDGTGSRDPEGGSLSYDWKQEGEAPVEMLGADTAAPTFVAPRQLPPGVELVFTLVVTDEAGAASERATVRVRVSGVARTAGPVVPVVTIEAEIASVVEGQVASYRIQAEPSPDRPIAIVMDVAGGEDYGVADGQRDVFILPGDTLAILVLATEDDYVDEPRGRIEAVIREQPLYRLGSPSKAHVIVNDNDLPSEPDEDTPSARRSVGPIWTVGRSEAPGFGTSTIDDMAFLVGEDVGLVRLPSATGGDRFLSYDLSPALPDGLHFDPNALTITGVPTAAQRPARFMFRVTDSSSNRASLTFFITVLEPASPSLTATREPEPTYPPPPAWTPVPRPTASQPVEDLPHPTSTPPAPEAPTLPPTAPPLPTPTPTAEAGEPTATAAVALVDDEQGVDQMGWIVTTALAGATAATGGLVFLRGVRR